MTPEKPYRLVTVEDLVRLTGKVHRTIRPRLAGLTPAKTTKKSVFYDAPEALAAIFAADRPALAPDATAADLKRRKLQLEVESLELDLGVKHRALVPMDRAVTVVAGEFAAVRAKLLAIPTKLAPIIAIMMEADAVCVALRAGIEEALAELSTEDALGSRLSTD
jgi:hypothetical protein